MKIEDIKVGMEVISHGVIREVRQVCHHDGSVWFTDGTTNYKTFIEPIETLQEKKARLEAELAKVTDELDQPKIGQVYSSNADSVLVTYIDHGVLHIISNTGWVSHVALDYIKYYTLTNLTEEEFIKELVK